MQERESISWIYMETKRKISISSIWKFLNEQKSVRMATFSSWCPLMNKVENNKIICVCVCIWFSSTSLAVSPFSLFNWWCRIDGSFAVKSEREIQLLYFLGSRKSVVFHCTRLFERQPAGCWFWKASKSRYFSFDGVMEWKKHQLRKLIT